MLVLAILARDKEKTLPLYFECLLQQTYPKSNTHLYIRTNDNSDATPDMIQSFINSYGHLYASVIYNSNNIRSDMTTHHDWNQLRFKILGAIRQESVQYAKQLGADYFVVDCDNFINPNVIEEMDKIKHLGVVSPMLRTKTTMYSNYHAHVTPSGYYEESPLYHEIWKGNTKGCIQVDVVHCVYFIRNSLLGSIIYDDGSGRHEYVIISDHLRKQGIPQYIDNRIHYGEITFDV
jgi:hypothetical protein